jgi:hypothetical protein
MTNYDTLKNLKKEDLAIFLANLAAEGTLGRLSDMTILPKGDEGLIKAQTEVLTWLDHEKDDPDLLVSAIAKDTRPVLERLAMMQKETMAAQENAQKLCQKLDELSVELEQQTLITKTVQAQYEARLGEVKAKEETLKRKEKSFLWRLLHRRQKSPND